MSWTSAYRRLWGHQLSSMFEGYVAFQSSMLATNKKEIHELNAPIPRNVVDSGGGDNLDTVYSCFLVSPVLDCIYGF